MPPPNLGHWWRSITFQKGFSRGMRVGKGKMNQGGNSSIPASQKDTEENAPLTIQPRKSSVPPPLLHPAMLVMSSIGCPAPKLSSTSERTSNQHTEAFSLSTLSALSVIWSRPHNALANGANGTRLPSALAASPLPSSGLPLPRIFSRTRYLSLPMKRGRSALSFTQNTLGRRKTPHPKEVLGDLISCAV